MGEVKHKVGKEEVIAKLKDDGDFDRLRLKITRKLKENEELRNSIIAAVKQSAALNRPGAENMRLRQLSDAIYDEIGNKVMGQISDGLWEIIRSEGGMKTEISETVESMYNKLVNPELKEKGESSKVKPADKVGNSVSRKVLAGKVDDMVSEDEPKEPPGFSMFNSHHSTHHQQQLPSPSKNGPFKKRKEEPCHLQNELDQNGTDVGMLPDFAEDFDRKQSCDASDEDPDVPPGFG